MLFSSLVWGVAGGYFRLSGALSTSSASSPVTSATRTVIGSGTLNFSGITSDQGAPQYSLNAGAFTTITEGMTLAVINGDTLAVRATLGTVGFQAGFVLKRNADLSLIETVGLART